MEQEFKQVLREELAREEIRLVSLFLKINTLSERYGPEVSRQSLQRFLAGLREKELTSSALPEPVHRTSLTKVFDVDTVASLLLDDSESTRESTQTFIRHKCCVEEQKKTCQTCYSKEEGAELLEEHPIQLHDILAEVQGDLPEHVRADSRLKQLACIDPNAIDGVREQANIADRVLGRRYAKCHGVIKSYLDAWRPMNNIFATAVRSVAFQCVSTLVIVANFLVIALTANWRASHIGQKEPAAFDILGYCFTTFYTLELACHLIVCGGTFWTGPDAGWNVFDFVIVIMGLLELVVTATGGDFVNASFLRVLRFARVSRVLKMLSAMRLFKEIKIMVESLIGSLLIFFWCSCLLVLLLALLSIFLVQGYANYMEEYTGTEDTTELNDYFGSVSRSMLTLFMCATGGDDWVTFYDAADLLGFPYAFLILIFLTFYHLAFFNVVVGVFCEKALNLARPTLDERLADRYRKEVSDARELYQLLNTHMMNGNTRTRQTMDADKFEKFIDDPEVERYFEVRGVAPSSARRFFKMLCELHGTNEVDFPTFVSDCIKLDRSASSIDLHVMSVRQLYGMHKMQTLQRSQLIEARAIQRALLQELDQQFQNLRDRWLRDFLKTSNVSSIPDAFKDPVQLAAETDDRVCDV